MPAETPAEATLAIANAGPAVPLRAQTRPSCRHFLPHKSRRPLHLSVNTHDLGGDVSASASPVGSESSLRTHGKGGFKKFLNACSKLGPKSSSLRPDYSPLLSEGMHSLSSLETLSTAVSSMDTIAMDLTRELSVNTRAVSIKRESVVSSLAPRSPSPQSYPFPPLPSAGGNHRSTDDCTSLYTKAFLRHGFNNHDAALYCAANESGGLYGTSPVVVQGSHVSVFGQSGSTNRLSATCSSLFSQPESCSTYFGHAAAVYCRPTSPTAQFSLHEPATISNCFEHSTLLSQPTSSTAVSRLEFSEQSSSGSVHRDSAFSVLGPILSRSETESITASLMSRPLALTSPSLNAAPKLLNIRTGKAALNPPALPTAPPQRVSSQLATPQLTGSQALTPQQASSQLGVSQPAIPLHAASLHTGFQHATPHPGTQQLTATHSVTHPATLWPTLLQSSPPRPHQSPTSRLVTTRLHSPPLVPTSSPKTGKESRSDHDQRFYYVEVPDGINSHGHTSSVVSASGKSTARRGATLLRRLFSSGKRRKNCTRISLDEAAGYDNGRVPYFVIRCMQEVEARGLNAEGIYRKSGKSTDVDRLCECYMPDGNSALGEYLISTMDIYSVACALKKYLGQLVGPIISDDVYDAFVAAGESRNPSDLLVILRQLPEANLVCIRRLISHLEVVDSCKEKHLMSYYNLAANFALVLTRNNNNSSSLHIHALVDATLMLFQNQYLLYSQL